MTCCILMGLVLLRRKSRRVAETIDSGTQNLEEGRCSQDALTRIMVAKHGKAARMPISCDSVCELVFSLRSKRRFRKARIEAARWVVATSFEPQSVLFQFPVSQILVHICTHDVPVKLILHVSTISTRHARSFHVCKGSDRRQRPFSCLHFSSLLFSSLLFSSLLFSSLLFSSLLFSSLVLLVSSRQRESVEVFPFLSLEPLLEASHLCFVYTCS